MFGPFLLGQTVAVNYVTGFVEVIHKDNSLRFCDCSYSVVSTVTVLVK